MYRILPILSLLYCGSLVAQNCPLSGLGVLDSPAAFVTATDQTTDAQGWTHFYNCAEGKIIVSLFLNGQSIGDVANGLEVKSGTLMGYGQGGQNLSNADYIDNDLWVTTNRYWQIKGATATNAPIRVRHYFNDTDVSDVHQAVSSTGFVVDEPTDLYFYIVGDAELHPYSTSVQTNNGTFNLYDMAPGATPDWVYGSLNDFYFAEMEIDDHRLSGSGGLLIFQNNSPVSIGGSVRTEGNEPVPGVEVFCGSSSDITTTNAAGQYQCTDVPLNTPYVIDPEKNVLERPGISVLDLVGINRGYANLTQLSPYEALAGDADNSGNLTAADNGLLRDLILAKTDVLPNEFFQFVPQAYQFPNPNNPFSPLPPDQIEVTPTASSNSQNFVAVKTGDVWQETDFPNDPPITLDPSFLLEDITSCGAGDDVVMPLRVVDFASIHGFQFTMTWDPEVLQYSGVENFGLDMFSALNVGTNFVDEGKLTVVWFTPDITTANTVADNDAIMDVRFAVVGSNGDNTTLSFANEPTPVQVLRANLSDANVGYSLGTVTVTNNTTIQVSDVQIEASSCEANATGGIDISVSGGNGNFSYAWSNGATTQDISNLAPGAYSVTISDGMNCPRVAGPFDVAQPNPLAIADAQLVEIECPGATDGQILLTTAGGTAPYSYQWSNGAVTEDLTQLPEGEYSVTITDANGCTVEELFVVPNPGKVYISLTVTDATSSDAADGALTVTNIFGGTPPYQYEWDMGATTASVDNLPPGNYSVTITDAEGCQSMYAYTVGVLTSLRDLQAKGFQLRVQPNPIRPGEMAYLVLTNPQGRSVQFRMFDMSSRQVQSTRFDLQRGETTHYFRAPETRGTYLIQVLPQGAGAKSIRVAVQ